MATGVMLCIENVIKIGLDIQMLIGGAWGGLTDTSSAWRSHKLVFIFIK
jgi:hypothetical protein